MVLLGDEDLAEHGLVCLETVLILTQHWCTVCTEHTIGIEIILAALMGLLGDEAQVQARFGLFGDSATLGPKLVHGFRRTYRRLGNSIGGIRWNSLVTWVLWNLVLICFETVLASVQYRSTVCVERTVGLEIVLEAPDGTPWWRGSSGSLVRSVWR
jgi:hypothetical protein